MIKINLKFIAILSILNISQLIFFYCGCANLESIYNLFIYLLFPFRRQFISFFALFPLRRRIWLSRGGRGSYQIKSSSATQVWNDDTSLVVLGNSWSISSRSLGARHRSSSIVIRVSPIFGSHFQHTSYLQVLLSRDITI